MFIKLLFVDILIENNIEKVIKQIIYKANSYKIGTPTYSYSNPINKLCVCKHPFNTITTYLSDSIISPENKNVKLTHKIYTNIYTCKCNYTMHLECITLFNRTNCKSCSNRICEDNRQCIEISNVLSDELKQKIRDKLNNNTL